ncbi:MAG: hypothetical protein Ct9H300mP27_12070 [Chloroflexota bacterium]|nr:MAG: hypothetical protein Ct9H300mP27_12070 [Chloroflexota bacterium]
MYLHIMPCDRLQIILNRETQEIFYDYRYAYHVVSSDKVKHPLDSGASGWSLEVSNDVEDLIAEMDKAGVECATLVQPNGTYALDNSYQCDSAKQYSPRTVSVGILDPALRMQQTSFHIGLMNMI